MDLTLDSTFPDKNRYLNLVAGISVLNGCSLLGIDFPGQIINLSGSPEDLSACCFELEEMIGKKTISH